MCVCVHAFFSLLFFVQLFGVATLPDNIYVEIFYSSRCKGVKLQYARQLAKSTDSFWCVLLLVFIKSIVNYVHLHSVKLTAFFLQNHTYIICVWYRSKWHSDTWQIASKCDISLSHIERNAVFFLATFSIPEILEWHLHNSFDSGTVTTFLQIKISLYIYICVLFIKSFTGVN